MEAEVLTAAGLSLLLGYALGSIPFGLILTRLGGAGDLRGIGSGNIGATNVLRTGRRGLAAATLALDAAKGAVAVWIAWTLMMTARDQVATETASVPIASLVLAIGSTAVDSASAAVVPETAASGASR